MTALALAAARTLCGTRDVLHPHHLEDRVGRGALRITHERLALRIELHEVADRIQRRRTSRLRRNEDGDLLRREEELLPALPALLGRLSLIHISEPTRLLSISY